LAVLPVDTCVVSEHCDVDGKFGILWRVGNQMRLLRLVRFLSPARFHRVLNDLHTAFGTSNAVKALIDFFLTIILSCHLIACLWGAAAYGEETSLNWIAALRKAKPSPDDFPESPFDVYWTAVYFSIVTLTSIGYGDITPQNRVEYVVCIICMSTLAGVWAYTVGGVCGIVATMEPHEVDFKQTMDNLNGMMDGATVEETLRMRARRYFIESRGVSKARVQQKVVDLLSPCIQGEVTLSVHKQWVNKVPFFDRLSSETMIYVVNCLAMMVYAPTECIQKERTLFIVKRGVGFRKGKILTSGDVWGLDMLLDNANLRGPIDRSSYAITYVTVLALHADSIKSMESKFPEVRKLIVVAKVKVGLGRALKKLAETRKLIETSGYNLAGMGQNLRLFDLYTDIIHGYFSMKNIDYYFTPIVDPKEARKGMSPHAICNSILESLIEEATKLTERTDELQKQHEDLQNIVRNVPKLG